MADEGRTGGTSAKTDVTIARSDLERVLARASELQGTDGESPEAISESRLVEIAREVGLDPNHVRQAMAEQRARGSFVEGESGFLLDALGGVAGLDRDAHRLAQKAFDEHFDFG